MRVALLACVFLLIMMWDGWYAKQGTSSRLAKDGGLAALQEWKETIIE